MARLQRDSGGTIRARLTAALLALLVVASGVGAAAGGGVAWGSDPAPNIENSYTVTKAVHDMSWGASMEDARKFEANDGEIETIEAGVNESADNPFSTVPTDWSAFPHAKDNVSELDSSEWTTDVSGSTGSISTSDVLVR